MSFFAMRKGERRDAWAAFLTLFGFIASHALLETARDALFLAKIPAERLPWVYLAIALFSIGLVELNARATRGVSPRRALSSITLLASLITLGFFVWHRQIGAFGLYALYVWSGLLVAFVLVHFWDLVGDRFTITQAKRLYGFIGAGSVLGAIAGSGAASVLARGASPERLVLFAAGGLAVAGLIPLLFSKIPSSAAELDESPELRETLAYVAQEPYARRVAVALVLATVCLTVSDFVFKSAIAALVPKAALGTFLGTVYFAVNVLSLICQLGLVPFLLRRLSLGAALSVLPALLVVSGLGVAVSAGLVTVLSLKAIDGSLRYSLHRTTAELVVLPFGEEARRRMKSFVDLVGQRGGQVLAALLILGLSALDAPPRVLAIGLASLSLIWCLSALSLRAPYVAVFRARLKAGRSLHLEEFPELDISSLETLLAAFESANDREVLAALDVLERENKPQLVPALLLHHPSELVVLRVLAILTRSSRKSAVPTIDRISLHSSPAVRAAALAARSVLAPDAALLEAHLAREEASEVRAAISANLAVSGALSGAERESVLLDLLGAGGPGSAAAQIALAEAIEHRRATGFEPVLTALASAKELAVRRAALNAIGSVAAQPLLPSLVDALADEETRSDAERALASFGADAFPFLRERFEDSQASGNVRWRMPHAMALCSPEAALAALIEWLPREPEGAVRFAILLTLERLVRQHPNSKLNRAALKRSVHETLTRAYRFLDARLLLLRGAMQDPKRKTEAHALLHDLLRDKEANAKGRLFRLLGLLHPTEDFGQIYRSLSVSKELRATGMELVESILREPIRSAVLGLIDDCADEQRRARAGHFHRPRQLGYAALLDHLAQGESDSVRQVARFHAHELGLSQQPQVSAA